MSSETMRDKALKFEQTANELRQNLRKQHEIMASLLKNDDDLIKAVQEIAHDQSAEGPVNESGLLDSKDAS